MYARASSLRSAVRGLARLGIPEHFFNTTKTRHFHSSAPGRLGGYIDASDDWLVGDQGLIHRPGLIRKQTFHIRPSSFHDASCQEEERFRLSPLDILHQNYSTQALIFKVDDGQKSRVGHVLKRGLELTLGQCRHMAGAAERDEQGDIWIVKRPNSTVKLVINRLDIWDDEYPSYTDLERARFTSESLGDQARLTIDGMTMRTMRVGPDEKPAMAGFQLNYIPGGLVLAVHMHHAASDLAGISSFIHQMANNCRTIMDGTALPDWDEGLMDRSRFVVHVAPEDRVDPPPAIRSPRHPDWHPCSMLLFHVPRSKTAELKRLATPEDGGWISTHDALVAMLWRIVARNRARIYKPDLKEPAMFFEPIDMRSRLSPPLPARYQGNCVSAAQSIQMPTPLTLEEVVASAPLSRIASFIRGMNASATDETLRETVDTLATWNEKWDLHPRLDALPPMALVLTDWRRAGICDADFGFGRPKAYRQLTDVAVENLAAIYPPLELDGEAGLDQGVEVVIPFETYALDMLFQDPDLARFFEFRGYEAK